MAKLSQIVRNNKRKKLSDKYDNLKRELRKKIIDTNLSDEERFMAQVQMQKLPRDASKCRYRNRCELTGRSRGFYRAFKLSRIKFRELAHQGMLPGVTKSSW